MDFSKISIIPIFLAFMDQIINQLIQRTADRLIYKYNHLKKSQLLVWLWIWGVVGSTKNL